MTQPNILLVFSDQHRFCDLGFLDHPDLVTPHFDAFARQAAVVRHCYANAPVCVPSRGCLMTGRLPDGHRAISNDLPVDTTCESIAHVMNRHGYRTGYIGKWHLAGTPRDKLIAGAERLGFQEWKGYNCNHDYFHGFYDDDAGQRHALEGYEPVGQTDLAIDFISRNAGQPWGLVLSYGPPHDPYQAVPDRWLDRYRSRPVQLRPNVPESICDRIGHSLDRQQIETNLQGYYAHIAALDEQFGRLMASLAATGQAEQTIVVYTSDHGDMLGSQGLTNKQLPYAESIGVPLLAAWPGHIMPGPRQGLMSLVDLPVTLLQLAGLSFAGPADGQDRSDVLLDPAAPGAEQIAIMDLVPCHQASARGGDAWRGVKTHRHTYARSYDGAFCVLFDDLEDPYQLVNLSGDPVLRQEMEQRLWQSIPAGDAFLPWPDYLRRFGYVAEWNRSQAWFHLPLLDP